MAWIESHQTLARHPKTNKLARALNVHRTSAIGVLHMFWWWAMDYAESGKLNDFGADDIADACDWDGESTVLYDALKSSRFIDSDEDGDSIHDWDDYAGRLVERRNANRERMQRARAAHVQNTNDATVPYRTVPNRTEPNGTPPKSPSKRGTSEKDRTQRRDRRKGLKY